MESLFVECAVRAALIAVVTAVVLLTGLAHSGSSPGWQSERPGRIDSGAGRMSGMAKVSVPRTISKRLCQVQFWPVGWGPEVLT